MTTTQDTMLRLKQLWNDVLHSFEGSYDEHECPVTGALGRWQVKHIDHRFAPGGQRGPK